MEEHADFDANKASIRVMIAQMGAVTEKEVKAYLKSLRGLPPSEARRFLAELFGDGVIRPIVLGNYGIGWVSTKPKEEHEGVGQGGWAAVNVRKKMRVAHPGIWARVDEFLGRDSSSRTVERELDRMVKEAKAAERRQAKKDATQSLLDALPDNGKWVKTSTIIKRTGWKRDALLRTLKHLEGEGVVERTSYLEPGERGRPSFVWRLAIPRSQIT